MKSFPIQGVYVPTASPFNHESEIYPTKVRFNIEKLNKLALAGYVVGGSTGETPFLSSDEKLQQWELVASAAAPGKQLIAGTGVEGVRETVALTNRAAGMGYTAALVINPHYYKGQMMKEGAQCLYFNAVADQAKIPIIVYNIPQNTGIDLSVEDIVRLSDHPNIVGLKESSGNVEKVKRLCGEVRNKFQIAVGSAPTFLAALEAGAVGGIFALANAAPYSVITVWEAFRTREFEAAANWQERIRRPAELVTVKHGVAGLKHAMDLNGYYGGPVRLPLRPLAPEARAEIDEAFASLHG